MNIEPVFQRHGLIKIDPEIISHITKYSWDNCGKHLLNHHLNPLAVSKALYVPVGQQENRYVVDSECPESLAAALQLLVAEVQTLMPNLVCLRGMLINLPPGKEQDWHVDPRVLHQVAHRLHVPLITNPDCVVEVGDQQQHFGVGELWEINNLTPHRAGNRGISNRIHFVSDWVDQQSLDQFGATMHQVRADILDNVDTMYESITGKCLFSPEKP